MLKQQTTIRGALALASVLAVAGPATASTIVSGTISTDTTWTLAGSPYFVTASVNVLGTSGPDGVTTLTIDPGVEVLFHSGTGLTIGNTFLPGALVAIGSTAQPVLFSSDVPLKYPGFWQSITFLNSATDATFDGVGHYLSGSTIQYATVEAAGGFGSPGALYLYYSEPYISNVTFQSNFGPNMYVYPPTTKTVPEPTTILFFGTGLAGLSFRARRQSH